MPMLKTGCKKKFITSVDYENLPFSLTKRGLAQNNTLRQ
jgi:hypothetical protein